MDRKLVSIRKVKEIKPIPNADNIELVVIDGWECISKKGEFKVDDSALYFEIDSLIPVGLPQFEFLRKSCLKKYNGKEYFRIRTIKLRGVLSQGLALPISSFNISYKDIDLVEFFGVIKYESISEQENKGTTGQTSINKPFPSYVPKSDQTRIQNLVDKLPEYSNIRWTIQEKMDGSSCTIIYKTKYYKGIKGWILNLLGKNSKLIVCSRNFELKKGDNIYWRAAIKNDLETKLKNYANMAFQFEVCGPKIQGNPYKLNEVDLYLYDIYDISGRKFLSSSFTVDAANILNIKHVPIIEKDFKCDMNLNELLAMADGKSKVNPETDREGLVFKAMYRIYNQDSFKVISNNFLLKSE